MRPQCCPGYRGDINQEGGQQSHEAPSEPQHARRYSVVEYIMRHHTNCRGTGEDAIGRERDGERERGRGREGEGQRGRDREREGQRQRERGREGKRERGREGRRERESGQNKALTRRRGWCSDSVPASKGHHSVFLVHN